MTMHRWRSRFRTGLAAAAAVLVASSLSLLGAVPAQASQTPTPTLPPTLVSVGGTELAPGVPAVDPQNWVDPDKVAWDEYKAVPGTNWNDPALQPSKKKFKVAMVLADYPDQRWSITQPVGSTVWGNPNQLAHDIPRGEVPTWYHDFFAVPSALNHGLTINGFWMEDSAGRYGVELTVFGVYELPMKSFQYHYSNYGNSGGPETDCPKAMACNGNFRNDVLAAWKADQGDSIKDQFDNVFYVGSEQDQSSTWQEFGEMMFPTPESVPDSWGPPQEWKDAVKAETGKDAPNWAPTRYVPWTSWKAAANLWPNASGNTSIETEGTPLGTYAHELSHNLGIADNYNNPYGVPLSRSYDGPWDNMATSYFNGPGGPHTRWHIPANGAGSTGGQHALRNKEKMGLIDPSSMLTLSREGLASSGVAVTHVTAREIQRAGELTGVKVTMDKDNSPACDWQSGDYQCDRGGFNNYTLEVIDRMGADSFVSDSGVMLAKTKNADRAPFVWTIDAHPEDLNYVNFYRPDGTPSMMSMGDYRQLSDALFHAGSGSGSQFEYVDQANKLHFYVLDMHRDADGVLSYDLAIRSTAGAGAQSRGVGLGTAAVSGQTPGTVAACSVPLTNTGSSVAEALYAQDVYRLTTTVSGSGWSAALPHQVVAAKAGESVPVTAYAVRAPGAAQGATVTITATSESDPSKSATSTCAVTASDTATPGSGVQVITAAVAGAPLTLTVPSTAPVVLRPVVLTGVDQVTDGQLNRAQVVDSRGTAAGWALTGQVSDFASASGTILADNLGWRPTADRSTGSLPVESGQDSVVTPGPVASPGAGLGSARSLCSAPVGRSAGSFACAGGLDLGIPGSARQGTYTATLTLTLI